MHDCYRVVKGMTKEEDKKDADIKRLNHVFWIHTGITYEEQLYLNKVRSKVCDELDKRFKK